MLDCTGVGNFVENEAGKKDGFILLALLTKFQLDCLEQIKDEVRDKFPEKEERALLNKIEDQVKKLKGELISLYPQGLKFIGISLLDYNIGGDISFNKFLVESLLSFYRPMKEKVNQKLKSIEEQIQKNIKELKKLKLKELSLGKDKLEELNLRKDKLEELNLRKDKLKGWISELEDADKFIPKLAFNKNKIDQYFGDRVKVNSLYKIHSSIESLRQILAGNQADIMEKRLALQRLFHITGEYLKDSQSTPNLSPDVKESLEEKGIPTKLLSKFRDDLAHYHIFPLIDGSDSEIKRLFDEGFLPIQRIIEDKIIEIENNFIQSIVEKNESKIDESVREFIGPMSGKSIRKIIKSIEGVKRLGSYTKMEPERKELVDEIYQNALRMRSRDFTVIKQEGSVPNLDAMKSKISNSITKYIKQANSKQKVYGRLYDKLELDSMNLENAHDDVLKITKVIDFLDYEYAFLSDDSILDSFLNMKILEKIELKVGDGSISLKQRLGQYFDVDSFKKKLAYSEARDIELKDLIELLNNVKEGKSELVDFLKSMSEGQPGENKYIQPDKYEELVNGLKISNQDKEKLLLYSVEWKKKKCINLLKKNPSALKEIYDSIMEGKVKIDIDNESLNRQYPGVDLDALPGKTEEFYKERVEEEFNLLREVKERSAVISQIINIYSLLEKDKKNQGDIFQFNKLRNYLSHGDALVSDKESDDIAERLIELKNDVVGKIIDEGKDDTITLKRIEEAIDRLGEVISLEGKWTIIAILCPSHKKKKDRKHARSAESCLAWEEIDKFNEGGPENRDPDNIKIDSEKFVSSILGEFEKNEEKFSNFIALAGESNVVGDYRDEVNVLVDKHKYTDHLERVGKISGMIMHGMIAKDIVGHLLSGDYKDVSIDFGFLAGSYGLAKVAELSSLKGAGYMLGGKVLLGKSLRFASPFISRLTTAFILYDLCNQVKEYEKGNKDALVPIIGDGLQLGVDSVTIGVEIGELLGVELLEGVSAVTGPIGMVIGAIVFVGTEVYVAVKMVEKIDEEIHLTGWERFTQGSLAFLGQRPSEYIEKLIGEKEANNEAVKNAINFLKADPNIRRYVFPSMEPATYMIPDHDIYERDVSHYYDKQYREEALNSTVLLDKKRNDIKWARARPDNFGEVNLFCLPKGDWESVPKGGSYYCENAIGVEYDNNRTGDLTLINLGIGKDRAVGFQNSSNLFILNVSHKEMFGGNKDDNFIFYEKNVKISYDIEINGSIDGRGGIDTIDVGQLPLSYIYIREGRYQVFADFREGILTDKFKVILNISNINQFLGRKGGVDRVSSACDTSYIDGRGGENRYYADNIVTPRNDTCFYDIKVIVNPYTNVTSNAIRGNFTYVVQGEKGKEAYVDLGQSSQSNNKFIFNYTLQDLSIIDRSNENITFSFKEKEGVDADGSFNLTINGNYKNITTYQLTDNTEIVVGQSNIYAMQNTRRPIGDLVKDYYSMAGKLQMYVIVNSNNEVLTIGSTNSDVLSNDPSARASHLVGGRDENVYVVISGHEKLTLARLPVSDVIIYDLDEDSKVDTLDLRKIREQLKKDLGLEVKTEISRVRSDLLINLFVDSNYKKEVLKVILKGALENNWYRKVHIVMDSVFLIEEIQDNFKLTPQPLIFDDNSKTIYVINPGDVVKENKIKIKKEIGDYTFVRDNDALFITNSLGSNADKNYLSTVILNDFYHENNRDKMQTLDIEFNDKKILLSKEVEGINGAGNFDELKSKVKVDSYKDVMRSIGKRKLFQAVEQNSIDEVKCLVEKGVDVNVKNEDGQMPLHYAASNGNLEVIKYLIGGKDADVNVESGSKMTPLHYAAEKGNLDVVKYLISKGANINVKDKFSKTPLGLATDRKVVEYLEKKLNETRGEPKQRKRRHHHGDHDRHHLSRKPRATDSINQPGIATNSTARPSSWVNDLFNWVKSSIGGLLSSALSKETSSTSSSISQVHAPVDVNGTIMLLDVLVRKVTGQKYISTIDQSISPLEAQGYALNITEKFEKVVEQAAKDSKISVHRLNIDFVEIQKEVTGKIMSGKFDEISGILNSHLEKACPGREAGCPGKLSEKKFNEFMAKFNKGLDVILNQSTQQILHKRDDTLEVNNIEEQQGPRSYLNNASIQGHLTRNKVKLIS